MKLSKETIIAADMIGAYLNEHAQKRAKVQFDIQTVEQVLKGKFKLAKLGKEKLEFVSVLAKSRNESHEIKATGVFVSRTFDILMALLLMDKDLKESAEHDPGLAAMCRRMMDDMIVMADAYQSKMDEWSRCIVDFSTGGGIAPLQVGMADSWVQADQPTGDAPIGGKGCNDILEEAHGLLHEFALLNMTYEMFGCPPSGH